MQNLAKALCVAQAQMTAAIKDAKNPHFKSSYATLESVISALRGPFAENGLCFSQLIETHESGRMLIRTVLLHISGEQLESRMMLPNIDNPQKIGSAITYYRRYSLVSLAGLPAEDEDGNLASAEVGKNDALNKTNPKIDQTTLTAIEQHLKNDDELLTGILQICGVSSLQELRRSQIETVRKYVRKKKAQEVVSGDSVQAD